MRKEGRKEGRKEAAMDTSFNSRRSDPGGNCIFPFQEAWTTRRTRIELANGDVQVQS